MDFVKVTLVMFVFLVELLLELLDHLVAGFNGVFTFFVELFQLGLVFFVELSLVLLGESVNWSCATSSEAIKWVLNVVT